MPGIGAASVQTIQEEILAAHTGRTGGQARDTERDLVLTPAAAVGYGVVDAVIRNRGE